MNQRIANLWEAYLITRLEISPENWVSVYESAIPSISKTGFARANIEDKITALALLHPDFYPSGFNPRGPRAFPDRPPKNTECASEFNFGYRCPLQTPSELLHMDHIWPYSLGGATRPTNGFWLCEYHNRLKGSDYHLLNEQSLSRFDWVVPILEAIRREII